MATLFLTSERLKADFANDNVADEYIRSAILIVQQELVETIGDCLYGALEDKVADNTINGTPYQVLLDDYIVPFLEFNAMAELCVLTSFKTGNIGTFTNYDQNASNNELSTVKYIQNHWAQKGEFYRNRLLKYLDKNKSDFPEWNRCGCDGLTNPSDNSITKTNIWLGGK